MTSPERKPITTKCPGGNKLEWAVRSELNRLGLFFEVDRRDILGTPDIVFPTQQIAVFIDGCFWHGCSLHRGKPAKDIYWSKYWTDIRARDRWVTESLRDQSWTVLRFWEHEPITEIALEIQDVHNMLTKHRTSQLRNQPQLGVH